MVYMPLHKKHARVSQRLCALTTAAIAIPSAVGTVRAATPPTGLSIDYRFSQYTEDDLAIADVAVGVADRYEIQTNQFKLVSPLPGNAGLTIDVLVESLSGASPFGTQADEAGNPVLIMTGASIFDNRVDVELSTRFYQKQTSYAVSVGFSDEDDYRAYNLAIDGDIEVGGATFSAGVGGSIDELNPTPQEGFIRVDQENKDSQTAFVGYSQVINKKSVAQISATGTRQSGFLSDPYKLVDIRPNERFQYAVNARYRYFFDSVDSALHLDYRFFHDDWDITSNTVEASWVQEVEPGLLLIPSVRYYSQSQAFFYTPIDNEFAPGFASSDFRLSPYGAVSFGLKFIADFESWSVTASLEQYYSDGDLALGSVAVEHPALVDFTRVSVGLDYRF